MGVLTHSPRRVPGTEWRTTDTVGPDFPLTCFSGFALKKTSTVSARFTVC